MHKRLNVTRRQVLRGAAAVAVASSLPRLASAATTVNATLDLTAASLGYQLSPHFLGLSAPKNYMTVTFDSSANKGLGIPYFSASNPPNFQGNDTLLALYRLLARNNFQPVLRLGANQVDFCNYIEDGQGCNITLANVNALAGFLNAANWKCLYGVNLAGVTTTGGLNYGTPNPGNDTQSVAEVVAVNKALGYTSGSLLAFEIGNEPDDYADNEPYGGDPVNAGSNPPTGGYFGASYDKGDNYAEYISRWAQYQKDIAAQYLYPATAPPLSATAAGGSQHQSALNQAFVESSEELHIALLTQHYYRGSATNKAVSDLVQYPDQQFLNEFSLSSTSGLGYIASHPPSGPALPWRIGECNSFFGDDNDDITYTFASALWCLDLCMTAAQMNCSGINLHGTGGGLSYMPIQDSTVPTQYNLGGVQQAMPSFYGLLLFNMAGVGQTFSIMNNPQAFTAPNNLNVSAYAIQNSATQISVIINNKDVDDLNFTITVPSTVQVVAASTGKYELTASGGLSMRATTPPTKVATINGEYIQVNSPTGITYTTPTLDTGAVTCTTNTVTTTVYAAGAVLVTIALEPKQ